MAGRRAAFRLATHAPCYLPQPDGQALEQGFTPRPPQSGRRLALRPTVPNLIPHPPQPEAKVRSRFPSIKINPFQGPQTFEVRRLKEETPKCLERTEAWAAHNKQYSGRLRDPGAHLENLFAQGIRHREALTNLSRNKTELFQTKTGTVLAPVMPPVRPPVRLVPLQKVTRGNVHPHTSLPYITRSNVKN